MNSQMEVRIARLLADGVAPEIIAQSLGTDVADILKIAVANQPEIGEAGIGRLEEAVALDQLITGAEQLAITRLAAVLPAETDVKKIVSAFSALNKAQRRQPTNEDGKLQREDTSVTIVLPATHVEHRLKEVEYERDINNQIVGVDGRAMLTMDATNVLKQARLANAGVDTMMNDRNIGSTTISIEDL
ncbi:hypothetical protein P5_0024 [Aeromonas phage P5]|nr:hypothetical protein P5_0024 [Aeromonas phage P5]